MKNNKKILNYLLVLCASFIISLCYVNAAINKYPLEPGQTLSFGDNYNFTSCENPDPTHFNIYGNGSNWKIEYHTYQEGLETFEYSCTGYKLDGKKDNQKWNYIVNVSGKTIITEENGIIERTISVNAGQKTTLNGYCQGRNNCKLEIIDNASGTLSVDGTVININRSNVSTSVQGKALLTYEENGITNKITIEIVIPDDFGGAIIYPGDTNLCKIDTSVWKAKDWLDSSNHHHPYYQAKGSATFPTCSGENSVFPLEFKGWVPTEPNKNITNLNESCSGMVSGTTADSTGSYFACYEAKPTIQIAVEANVSNPQDWQKVTGMGYYYVGNNTKEVKLPELSFIGFNKNKELDYWESDKGERKQSGDSVPLDGSIWKAIIKTSSTIDIRGYERNIYIGKVAVFSSVTDKITSCSSGSEGIVKAEMVSGECQVIGLQDTNGEYSAKVFAVTDKGETINYKVKVTGYSGSQNGGVAFEVDTSDNVNFEVVKQPSKQVTEDKNKDSVSTSIGTSTVKTTCTRFQFSYNAQVNNPSFEADYFHISNRVGNSVRYHAFCVPDNGQFVTDNSGKPTGDYPEYNALCLEENQAPPNNNAWNTNYNSIYGVEYTLDELGDGGIHLRFVLDYIVKNYYYDDKGNPTGILNDGKNPKFVAAQILTRLAWIKDGQASTEYKSSAAQSFKHSVYADVVEVFFNSSVKNINSNEWQSNVLGVNGNCSSELVDPDQGGKKCWASDKSGTGLGIGDLTGESYDIIREELWKVHNLYIEAGGYDGLKENSTVSVDGFVGNDVPDKNSDGERNPVYETNNTNSYSVTYEGSIIVTEKFKDKKITLDTSSCNWNGVKCEVVSQPEKTEESDSNGNFKFKYKVKITVTDAANVKVPETAEEKDKVSFKVLVDGKNISFSDAFILHVENNKPYPNDSTWNELGNPIPADQYQRMLVFNPEATDTEAKLYFPFLLIPSKCTDVPATNFENYGNSSFNQALFLASNCCKDVTNDVENQELLQQVCEGKCTTSTFTNVCRWDTKHDTDAELYLIKEGTRYKDGQYENQIGACIVDVEHDYSVSANKPFFEKTDDNANPINLASYKNNRYCQVTCKEDWSISMDSFGNYVGVKSIAAGTSFAINNDMFISGERTCYSSYVNTNQYMDDMTKLSDEIVKQYNIYSNNSNSYTAISNMENANLLNVTNHSNVCVQWNGAPKGYETTDYKKSGDDAGYFVGELSVVPKNVCPSETKTIYAGSCVKAYNTIGGQCINGGTKYGSTCVDVQQPDGSGNCDKDYTLYKQAQCVSNTGSIFADYVYYEKNTCQTSVKPNLSEDEYESYKNRSGKTLYKYEAASGGYCHLGGTIHNNNEYVSIDTGKIFTPTYECPVNEKYKDYNDNNVKTSTDSDSLTADSKCQYKVELSCKTYGRYFDYELKSGQGKNYTRYSTSIKTIQPDAFGGNKNIENQASGSSASYERNDKITCTYVSNKGPSNTANLNCYFGSDTASSDGSPKLSEYVTNYVTNYCGTPLNGTNFCATSSRANMQKAFDDIKGKALYATENAAKNAQGELSKSYKLVSEYTQDLYSCQNFYLYNVSDNRNVNKGLSAEYKPLGIDVSPVKIDTKFEPAASYKYDEAAFMTLLGADNVIEEYTNKNRAVMEDWDSANNVSVDAQIKAFDKYGNEYNVSDVKLMRNKTETKYYYGSPWTKDSYNYNNYVSNNVPDTDYEVRNVVFCTAGIGYGEYKENGKSAEPTKPYVGITASSSNDVSWKGGECYTVQVKYRKANYISSYIGNSSFYQNKGNWYMNTATDIKEHGDNLEGAIANANARSSSIRYKTDEDSRKQWTLINGTTQNVFPVSLTTPRNLYQYTYSFTNIGYFNDNKRLGRIMGDQSSIIASNVRTCFYEIYEDVCLCCGSAITTNVDNESYVDAKILSKIEQIGGGKGNYTYNNSNADAVKNSSGTLKIIPSTVSLGDVTSQYGNSNATIPTNWSDKSPFIYNGAKYYTDKGSVALKQIEDKGEHIYAATAEYSYYLTPDTLAAIREYNDVNGYEINANNLRVVTDSGIYGYAINASQGTKGAISSSDGNREGYVMFQHYGSKFLENEMWSYNAVLSNTLAQTKNNKICYVEGKVDDINNKVKEGCRWVDYIQTNQPVDNNDKKNENVPFRLAFK